jgi:hypothetical protein
MVEIGGLGVEVRGKAPVLVREFVFFLLVHLFINHVFL